MDQSFSEFELKKKKIIETITKILLDSLAKEEIDKEKGSEIATYILDNKKNVIDETSLLSFLQKLAEQYPIYKNIANDYQKIVITKNQDDAKIEVIKQQLSKLANSPN